MNKAATLQLSAAVSLILASATAVASSHREAPFTGDHPRIDATDLYMFRSYEANRADFVTVLANYRPFQDPQGGPNFYRFSTPGRYDIHFDNNGDGVEDVTFQFDFADYVKGQALPAGGKMTKIPLINSGQITAVDDPNINRRETYTVRMVRRTSAGVSQSVLKSTNGEDRFDKPLDNIGEKTFPGGYANYANQHIYSVNIPNCATPAKIFVGQRKEPFYIAVGKIFDLFNLNPLGPQFNGNNNDLEAKNVSTIAMEVPISCITMPGEPVVGAFTTAVEPLVLMMPDGAGKRILQQRSRLGMPLVNEVIIGLPDKDRFNESRPRNDAQFLQYVTHPSLPTLVQSLFPAAKAPTNFPRTDLVAAFLTGISGLNQPQNVVPAEMLRLNTSIPATAPGAQSPLGVAGGDLAGFPNGRRPGDDVVDLSLRVAMGALCVLTGPTDTFKVGCMPSDAPAGGLPFTDGVRKNAQFYQMTFPYLTTPIPGNFNPEPAPGATP